MMKDFDSSSPIRLNIGTQLPLYLSLYRFVLTALKLIYMDSAPLKMNWEP